MTATCISTPDNNGDPYDDWIAANVSGTGYGECASVTEAMAKAFPELRRVRGYYYCAIWGQRGHWWLETPMGRRIDPTKRQFPTRGRGHYEEFTGDESELPTGKCANCSGPIYNHFDSTVCSDACGEDYVRYINDELRS